MKHFEFKITNKIEIVPKASRTGHRGIRNLGVTCYINSTINGYHYIRDEHAFVFNLQSNGRYPTPMKFDIKNKYC